MTRESVATHLKVVLGESAVASSAATLCVAVFEVPVWAMFIGWISFFTRGANFRHGLVNLACVLGGVTLGIGAASLLSLLTPHLEVFAVGAVVFAITVVTLSLAKAPVFNNLLGFFLGLVAYFASHQPPSFAAFGSLALAAALGTTAAFLAHSLQKRLQQGNSH